jgi:hypothetical protein
VGPQHSANAITGIVIISGENIIKSVDNVYRLVFFLNSNQHYRFDQTSQEIHYTSATSLTG